MSMRYDHRCEYRETDSGGDIGIVTLVIYFHSQFEFWSSL